MGDRETEAGVITGEPAAVVSEDDSSSVSSSDRADEEQPSDMQRHHHHHKKHRHRHTKSKCLCCCKSGAKHKKSEEEKNLDHVDKSTMWTFWFRLLNSPAKCLKSRGKDGYMADTNSTNGLTPTTYLLEHEDKLDDGWHDCSTFPCGSLIVVLTWIAIIGATIYFPMKFVNATNLNFKPPRGSAAELANDQYKQYFPDSGGSLPMLVLISVTEDAPNTTTVLSPWVKNATDYIVTSLMESEYASRMYSIVGHYTLNTTSNYTGLLVTPDQKMTIISLSYSISTAGFGIVEFVRDVLDTLNLSNNSYLCEVTGQEPLFLDMNIAVELDLLKMDLISFPLAMVIIGLVLRSSTLIIIPILNVIICNIVSFGLMYPIALVLDVASYCPPVMMSITVALNIDYCLFLLTRYQEELRAMKPHSAAVYAMLKHSGSIIVTSGGILLFCFLSLCLFPLSFISSFGISTAITLGCTLLINTSLTPSLLLLFSGFFSSPFPCLKRCRRSYKPSKLNAKTNSGDKPSESDYGVARSTSPSSAEIQPTGKCSEYTLKFWKKYSAILTQDWRASLCIAIAVVICFVPVIYYFRFYTTSYNDTQVLPSESASMDCLVHLQEGWPAGIISPYTVLVVSNRSIYTPATYQTLDAFAQDIAANVGGITIDSVTSISNIMGRTISWPEAMVLLLVDSPYRDLCGAMVSTTENATLVTVITNFDPSSNISGFVTAMRVYTDAYSKDGFEFYLKSQYCDENDAVDRVLEMFPFITGVAGFLVLLLLAVAFKSLVVPLRTLLTVFLSMGFVFGLVVMVFIKGYFSPLIEPLPDGIYWFSPIIAFVLLLGLALDYDVFLFSRINELRLAGYAPKQAVALGLQMSGPIVIFAGIIMAVAFGALLFSLIDVVLQMGFFLTAGVLEFTFVQCCLFIPCIVALLQNSNWLPRLHIPITKFVTP